MARMIVLGPGVLISTMAIGRVAFAPDPEDHDRATRVALAQLEYLRPGLEARADQMQAYFPEGRVFTLALYGLTWVDIGLGTTDAATRARALAEARHALALATAPRSLKPFEEAGGLPYGMFYEGWTAHLRAGTLHLGGGAAADTAFRGNCARLDASLRAHGPFADSYGGMAWPADNAAGAAALASCGTLLDPRYGETARAWLRAALRQADPATGIIPHVDGLAQPRGESAVLMIRFIHEIDPRAAAAQYDAMVRTFATRFAGLLPAVREYPHGMTGDGDVDSGPVILGVSAPASVVGVAAARITGHARAAADLRASAEVLGMPLQWGGRRSYAFGALPVGDAFLAWVTVVRPWNTPPAAPVAATPFGRWRWTWYVLWGGLLALSAMGLTRLARQPASTRSR
ncbi:hypothetical protein [Longimicrobium sp.]|uniref:hypothetical protein n=1 Tax=Longimicrobium sp. TaxID=2029185 RepID=UPI002E349837|nr:hypothetical protein [Longimicrobium sp.]HEX6040209.1 hypothetical protein [Longimicrobium sp.]